MNKSSNLLAGLLLGAAMGAALWMLSDPGQVEQPVATVTLAGEVVDTIDLTRVEEPYTLSVDGPGGFSNTILVEPGRIRVESAGCPDQVCVDQGFISDGATPIVCLPNQLIIEIAGGGSDLDGAAG